jgi:hypothetical protein
LANYQKFNIDCCVYIESLFTESPMDACHAKILSYFASNPEYVHDESFIEKSDTDVTPRSPQLDSKKLFGIVEDGICLKNLTENTPYDITDICIYRNMLYRFSDKRVLVNRD